MSTTTNEPAYAYSDFLNEHTMNADTSTVNNLLVNSDLTLSYLNNNSILTSDSNKKVMSKNLLDNQIIVGKTNDEPQIGTLKGTTNQVQIDNSGGNITFSLPQNIHTLAEPKFYRIFLDHNGLMQHLVLDWKSQKYKVGKQKGGALPKQPIGITPIMRIPKVKPLII